MRKSVSDSCKRCFFYIALVLFFLATMKGAFATVASYNFSAETNIWATECHDDTGDAPPPINTLSLTCDSSTNNLTSDAALDSSDNNRERTSIEGVWEGYGWIMVNVSIQESSDKISTLNWTVEVNGDSDSATIYMYYWNSSSSSWSECGSVSSSSDRTVNCILNSTTLLSSSNNAYLVIKDSEGIYTSFYTDYIGLQVDYTPNSNPSVTTPIVKPTIANTTSTLTANTTYTDADGDIGNVLFKWYVNNTNVYNTSFSNQVNGTVLNVTLGSANFTHFNLVNVTVNATDNNSQNSVAVTSATLNISNLVPTIGGATVSPDPAVDASDLTCLNSSISDGDGDSVTAEYTWFNDSVRVSDLTEQIVGAGNTTVGEQWYCLINVTDSYNYSGAVTSQTVIIGSSSVAPTINSSNSTTEFTNIISNATNPTNNNSWVNLSVLFHDDNNIGTNDEWTAYFCKTDVFSGTCSGGQFCKTTTNSTTYPIVNCKYIVENETTTTINYYVYVIDNTSLHQGSGSGTAGTFTLNYPPPRPTISAPTNNTWTNVNSTFIQWTGTDPDSDNITWYIYADTTSDPTTLVNFTTGAAFNWTDLNETNYYIKILANDSHGYESLANSTFVLRKFDFTAPLIQNTTLSSTSIYTDETVTISADCSDTNSGTNTATTDFNITNPLLTTTTEAMALSNGSYVDVYTPLGTTGTYDIGTFRCYDLAGNLYSNVSALQFTTSTRPSGGGAASGGGAPRPQTVSAVEVQAQGVPAICGNNKCEPGETPASCFADCPVNVDRFITCLWDPETKCLYGETWFVTLLVLIVVGGAVFIQYQAEQKKQTRRRVPR